MVPEETRARHAAPAPLRPRPNPGWGLVILGGLLGVLGAFLTWATVDYGGLATHTYRGVSAGRDGKITVVLAVLVLGLVAAAFLGWVRGWMRAALALLGLVIAFVAVADLAASPSVGSEEQARLQVAARVTSSNGIGEWLTLIAGILVVIGVVLVGRYSRPMATASTPLSPTVPTSPTASAPLPSPSPAPSPPTASAESSSPAPTPPTAPASAASPTPASPSPSPTPPSRPDDL